MMTVLNRILLLPLFLITLFSCKNQDENAVHTTYIAGQIVNPTHDFVVFSRGSEILDTVKLDANNFFEYRTDKIKAGLHFFSHSEGQVFYIEPGDSLLIHINTVDFDESLAFSGKGGEQNNLLIELYLQNEIENKNLSKWYNLSSKDFEIKIDSLKDIKVKEYEEFINNNEVAEDFKNIALANIEYDHYSKKEMYGAANRSMPDKFEKNYYDYRKNINFNLDQLKFYYPYYRFMNRYFENMVCKEYDKKKPADPNSFAYNYRKIELIDSVVSSDSIKNRLLRYNARFYLLNANNAEEEKRYFETFSTMNTDDKSLEEIKNIYDVSVKLIPGLPIPNVILVNSDNVLQDIQSVITAPTVVYFWAEQPMLQHRNQHIRANELKSKYPEYDFIGINVDKHFKKWRNIVQQSKYDPKYEFQIENFSEAEKKLLLRSINNVIIVDENGIILEGKTNMYKANFEEQLLGFLNK